MTTPGPARLSERYRTLAALGRGGMGSVEIALEKWTEGNEEHERIVALKRLLPDAKARHSEMFLREARLAVLLDHPNVVHAFDYGELEGELFMAMEYVEGEPLSRVLGRAKEQNVALDVALVAKIIADVCDGLHAAHELRDEAGHPLRVVHRDVSPHNVMVSYDGHVKVVDFGVAKIDDSNGYTRTGEVKGKAAYMSPEQAMGDALDRRSDLYSVGAVLFECLTGRRMWEGTDMEVMRKLALSEPPPLPADVPEHVRALYKLLVSRDANARPRDAAEVALALRQAVDLSPQALPALMKTLFGERAAERKAELDRAIASVDPANLDALRKSLAPGAPRTVSTRVQATPSSTKRASPTKSSRGVVLLAGGLVLVGGVAMAMASSKDGVPTVPSASSTPPAPPPVTTAVPATSAEPVAAASMAAPEVASPSTPTASASAATKPTTNVMPANARSDAGTRPLLKPSVKPNPSAKPLDVDPNAL